MVICWGGAVRNHIFGLKELHPKFVPDIIDSSGKFTVIW